MAYKFLDVIENVSAELRDESDQAKQELQKINQRQAKLEEQLTKLEPRQLRARSLKTRDDLICAECFILHDIESPLSPIRGDSHVDRFRCRKCDAEYELEA